MRCTAAAVACVVLACWASGLQAQVSAQIGRDYFHDKRLSSDGGMACATCHVPGKALQDGYERALARRLVQTRNTPSLLNVGRHTVYFWDGRARSLEAQIREPLFARSEMNASAETLQQATASCPASQAAWLASGLPIADFVVRSLADYVRSVGQGDKSRFELFLGGQRTLSRAEAAGWAVFSSKLQCVRCHRPPALTDDGFHDIGLPRRHIVLQTTADRSVADRFQLGFDYGRSNISDQPADQHKFRTPSLYNVMQTAPYMHDGAFRNIDEVLDFYSRQRVADGKTAISAADKRALVALLSAMTEQRPAASANALSAVPDHCGRTGLPRLVD